MTRVIRGQHITNISAPGPPIEKVYSSKSDQGGPKHYLSPKKSTLLLEISIALIFGDLRLNVTGAVTLSLRSPNINAIQIFNNKVDFFGLKICFGPP